MSTEATPTRTSARATVVTPTMIAIVSSDLTTALRFVVLKTIRLLTFDPGTVGMTREIVCAKQAVLIVRERYLDVAVQQRSIRAGVFVQPTVARPINFDVASLAGHLEFGTILG